MKASLTKLAQKDTLSLSLLPCSLHFLAGVTNGPISKENAFEDYEETKIFIVIFFHFLQKEWYGMIIVHNLLSQRKHFYYEIEQ